MLFSILLPKFKYSSNYIFETMMEFKMQELSVNEIEQVGGGDLAGFFWGAAEGFATGALIGNRSSTAGGWGFGLLSQIFGTVIGAIGGAVSGSIVGALSDVPTVATVFADYRAKLGSPNTPSILG